jgi:putative ABC transport system permease protein
MLVGLYLEFIFDLNSPVINISWVLIMVVAAAITVSKRTDLKFNFIFIPILTGIATNVLINGLLFAFIVIGTAHILDARYLIPLMGMIIGNTLNASIIGIRTYFNQIKANIETFKYDLLCGATLREALMQFNTGAYREAFNPVIASTAVIGLIWLPGMMTGQILSGSSPMHAIKYQIIIIITIFAGTAITIFTSLTMSKKFAFDQFDNLKKDIFKKK